MNTLIKQFYSIKTNISITRVVAYFEFCMKCLFSFDFTFSTKELPVNHRRTSNHMEIWYNVAYKHSLLWSKLSVGLLSPILYLLKIRSIPRLKFYLSFNFVLNGTVSRYSNFSTILNLFFFKIRPWFGMELPLLFHKI